MLPLLSMPILACATPSQDVDKCADRYMRERAHEIDWRDQHKTRKKAEKLCEKLVAMACEGQDRDGEVCRRMLGESRPIR